ncbi:MAG: GTPase HflX [Burkholderiales bacterium]|nr:GTPase HflX [Burkholderiales bacterium]
MFERHAGNDRAVLVQLAFGKAPIADDLEELQSLAATAGAATAEVVTGRRDRPDAALFAGRGKVQEISDACVATQSELVIFNHPLSGVQERNLERELSCRVIDRRTLILDIFAQRARSAEGKLAVELAQLEHLATRLVRGWSHLERQRGGIGLRGPGEKQLEIDRRLISGKIRALRERLDRVERQRHTQRRRRERSQTRAIAIVGYTNAGKSTLFNRLTAAGTYAADQLFATLDTTVRKLYVADAQPLVVSDTVGFVRALPHELVEAFKATLLEAVEADLLLHVVDGASDQREAQIEAVNAVLAEIGAADIPQLIVVNKCDLLGLGTDAGRVEHDESGQAQRVFVSARTGAGIAELRNALQHRFPAAPRGYDQPLDTDAANDPALAENIAHSSG